MRRIKDVLALEKAIGVAPGTHARIVALIERYSNALGVDVSDASDFIGIICDAAEVTRELEDREAAIAAFAEIYDLFACVEDK